MIIYNKKIKCTEPVMSMSLFSILKRAICKRRYYNDIWDVYFHFGIGYNILVSTNQNVSTTVNRVGTSSAGCFDWFNKFSFFK